MMEKDDDEYWLEIDPVEHNYKKITTILNVNSFWELFCWYCRGNKDVVFLLVLMFLNEVVLPKFKKC